MNSSRALSLAAVSLALLVTVPLKLTDAGAAQQSLSQNLEQAIATMLAEEGFELKIGAHFGFVVDAQQNNCRLQLREAVAAGYNADAITKDSPKSAQLAFEYGGKLWNSHPTLRATISAIWSRLKWQLRIDNSWSPVVSIAATGRCTIEKLPWQRIANVRSN